MAVCGTSDNILEFRAKYEEIEQLELDEIELYLLVNNAKQAKTNDEYRDQQEEKKPNNF